MDFEGKHVPFEVNQLLEFLLFENLPLTTIATSIHDILTFVNYHISSIILFYNMLSHYRHHIDSVTYFV
jgi:hypothetical protein